MTQEKQSPLRPKNKFEICGLVTVIHLSDEKCCFIDTVDIIRIINYKWRAVKSHRCWYAKTTVGKPGNQFDLSMHRMIARAGRNQQTHHRNRNSLDNRKANLLNMSRNSHMLTHRNNRLLIKFDEKYLKEKGLTQSEVSALL